MQIEQNIREAFDACAKVRNEKAKLYGNAWRMVDYYTLVHIILPIPAVEFIEVEELNDNTDRGANGYGSSGK